MHLNNLFDVIYDIDDSELNKIINLIESTEVNNFLLFKKTILQQFALYFFKNSNKTLSCCLLKKNYLSKYKVWILEKTKIITIIHFDNSFIINNDRSLQINYIHYMKHIFFYNDSDISLTDSQHELYSTYFKTKSNDLIDRIKNYNSGFHINFNDSSWQTIINYFIFINMGLPDKNDLLFYNFKQYKKYSLNNCFYDNQCRSIKEIILKYDFFCDICVKRIDKNNIVYSNNNLSLICNYCYLKKENEFNQCKKDLIKKFLLKYKQNIFKKKLAETRIFLKNYNFKSENKDIRLKLYKNIFDFYNQQNCEICKETLLGTKIMSSSCGHCFHQSCLNKIIKDDYSEIKCPLCRQYNTFHLLYL